MKKLLIVFMASMLIIAGYAQDGTKKSNENDYLKGLTKAQEGDINHDEPIMFDGESIPVYTKEGKRVKGMDMMKMMMSGDFTPEPYINKEKEVKVFVLRPATKEEKQEMQMMQKSMQGESEQVGAQAMPFSATDMNGEEFSLESLKGKIIVMNFWFTACKPCVMEMPDLNEIVKEYKGKDVVFLGFANDKNSKIEKFLEDHKFEYHILPNSGKVAKDYGVSSYPTHIIIDKEGEIIFMTSGLGPTTIDSIKHQIESLMK